MSFVPIVPPLPDHLQNQFDSAVKLWRYHPPMDAISVDVLSPQTYCRDER
jgi:hypothetical protein